MEKSWYQILNIFQSPSPSVSDSILRGVLCGYLSEYQQIAIHNYHPKFEYGVCYRDKSDKKQKKTLTI